MRLFHVSENGHIDIFQPRALSEPTEGAPTLAVWAIDEEHLPNYLLPRDCPRVTYAAIATTSTADREGFFDHSRARRIIVVEQSWFERIRDAVLHIYEMPPELFAPLDKSAGYYVAQRPVSPLSRRELRFSPQEIDARDCELRFVPDLWPIRDNVMRSTLDYSIIRMRNAQPRS
jgi:hypothetical protein